MSHRASGAASWLDSRPLNNASSQFAFHVRRDFALEPELFAPFGSESESELALQRPADRWASASRSAPRISSLRSGRNELEWQRPTVAATDSPSSRSPMRPNRQPQSGRAEPNRTKSNQLNCIQSEARVRRLSMRNGICDSLSGARSPDRTIDRALEAD